MDRRIAEGMHEFVETGLKPLPVHLRAFSTRKIYGHPDLGLETPGCRLACFQHAGFMESRDLPKKDASLDHEPSMGGSPSS